MPHRRVRSSSSAMPPMWTSPLTRTSISPKAATRRRRRRSTWPMSTCRPTAVSLRKSVSRGGSGFAPGCTRRAPAPAGWRILTLCSMQQKRSCARHGRKALHVLSTSFAQEEYRWCTTAGIAYWTRDTLDAFCEYVLSGYSPGTPLATRYAEKWRYHQRSGAPGGICDMTALHLFVEAQEAGRAVNLCEVRGGVTCDFNTATAENLYPDEYRMDSGLKAVCWDDHGRPHGDNLCLDQPVRFQALHFAGQTKSSMPALPRSCLRCARTSRTTAEMDICAPPRGGSRNRACAATPCPAGNLNLNPGMTSPASGARGFTGAGS